jgi:transposase InsO family protein
MQLVDLKEENEIFKKTSANYTHIKRPESKTKHRESRTVKDDSRHSYRSHSAEGWLNDYHFPTRAEAKKAVFEYSELFYNRRKTHPSNGYVPPLKV